MIGIAVVGYGYWGPNLVRNLVSNENADLKTVVDKDKSRLKFANKTFPHLKTTENFDDVLEDADIKAIVIATPLSTHYALAKKALLAGKHVLVEKPIAKTSHEILDLMKIAEENNLILMVDHIYLYHGAVRKIQSLVAEGQLGKIQYFDSTRINLGLFQQDSNVLWDLAVHDLSILNLLVSEKPRSVIATGVSHTENNIENMAFITLRYDSGMLAHISCSWVSPVKIRQILVGGTNKMVLYNDVEPTEKIKVYDTKYTVLEREKMLVDYRIGDVNIPKFDPTEALTVVIESFLASILTGEKPLSDGQSGLEIVRILEAAQESILNNGKEIIIHEINQH